MTTNGMTWRAARRALCAILLFLGPPALAGQWCATSECPGCAAHGLGSGHGRECFATQDACQARLSEVLAEPHGGVTYSACTEEGGSDGGAASAPAPGHEMDPYISQAISHGINGDISASDAAGLVGLGLIGNAILAPRDPAQEAARAAAAEAAARQRASEEEERKQRLLGQMLDVDAPPLASPTFDGGGSAGNSLGLMLDDDVPSGRATGSGFMPQRHAPAATNPQPAAARNNPPGPYNVPARPGPGDNPLGLMRDDEPARERREPQPEDAPDPARDDAAFNKGFVDGSQCYSASAGNHCAGAAGAIHQNCIATYEAGYRQGEGIKRVLLEQAHQAGDLDRQQGRRNASFTSPQAQGPCRTQWIESYNAGYNNVPTPRMGR